MLTLLPVSTRRIESQTDERERERATSKCKKKKRKSDGKDSDGSEKRIMERKTRHGEKESGRRIEKERKKGKYRGDSTERCNGRRSETIKKHEVRKWQREKLNKFKSNVKREQKTKENK